MLRFGVRVSLAVVTPLVRTSQPPMIHARPLRICIVAPYDLSIPGGVNTQIRAQARALRALGHDVRVAGPASGPLGNGEVSLGASLSVTLGGTESGLGLDPRSVGRTTRMFGRERFDVVHVHEPLTPVVPWVAVWRARAPVVGTFHVHREEGHRLYAAAAPLLRPLVKRLSARIAVSAAAKRTVDRHFPGDYEIVPNGIELDAWVSPRPRPSIFEPGRCHVLYVGRLEPRKGVEHLIEAMSLVQARTPARLIVAGDGGERPRLEQLAGALGIDVRFAGRVEDDVLPAYFQSADIVSSPAVSGESFGIVLLEAMACGTPVVASRIEGYADLVTAVGGGRLVPPADPAALGAAIGDLLADRSERAAIGRAGAAAAAQYDWAALARRLEAIYLKLIP